MKKTLADLHLHTTASDGVLTPTQVVEEAHRIGLSALAITDHDTVSGVEEACRVGEELGVVVVPAIEINTDLGPIDAHILGYFMDYRSEKLLKQLEKLRKARQERAKKIVDKLRTLGAPVALERVLEMAGNGSVGRPHIAQAMVEAGVVESIGAAFNEYLIRGAPAYVKRSRFSPYEAVTIIIEAGGVAGLAHPAQVGRDDLIMALMKYGLGALEVHFTGETAEMAAHYQALARYYSLIPTGGSDAHGFNPDSGATIGSVTVDISVVEQLRAVAPAGHCIK